MTNSVIDMTNNGNRTPEQPRVRFRLPCSNESSNAIENKYYLPQEWANWIEGLSDWSWFGHFTFKGLPHPEFADKTWKLYTHKLNREIFGCRYYKYPLEKGVTWARASEYQKRGSIHYHALMGRISEDVDRFKYMEEWLQLGGICRIFPYDKMRGAEFYLSKSAYAWKHGEIDIGGPVIQSSIPLRSKS